MAIVLNVLKSVGMGLVSAILTKKVIMKLVVVGIEKLISMESTGHNLDEALKIIKEAVEKENEK